MKRSSGFVIILLLSFCIQGLAQDTSRRPSTEFYPVIRKWYCVKLNPASLYFGKASLFGEYTPKRRYRLGGLNSFIVGIGIPIELEHRYTINKKERTLKMKTSSVMAGYRVYRTDGTGPYSGEISGFYVEPYFKYINNSTTGTFDTDISTSTTTTSKVTFSSASRYSGVGFGIQFGFQFHIHRRYLVDAFIVGPEINGMRTNISIHDQTSLGAWNYFQSEDAQKNFDDYKKVPILGRKLSTNRDDANRTISGSYKGLLPGFRIGISIGYAFKYERPV